VDVLSGQQRELLRPQAPTTLRWPTVTWTPDASAVIVVANDQEVASASPAFRNGSRVLIVPIDGGTARTLPLPPGADAIRVHPDGKQLTYVVGQGGTELWALENFLPPQTAIAR
jgi:hypothetical protein